MKDPETASRFERYLDITCNQILRRKDVANMLIKFGKTDGEARSRTDLNKVIEETLYIMKSSKRLSQFRVETELSQGLPAVSANECLLREVFASLIQNSVEAKPSASEGLLRISTRAVAENNAQAVHVRFADNGCGIDDELIPKIFILFFTTKGSARVGLGLAVAHGILAEHGGRIEVESAAGRGSAFTVVLPVK